MSIENREFAPEAAHSEISEINVDNREPAGTDQPSDNNTSFVKKGMLVGVAAASLISQQPGIAEADPRALAPRDKIHVQKNPSGETLAVTSEEVDNFCRMHGMKIEVKDVGVGMSDRVNMVTTITGFEEKLEGGEVYKPGRHDLEGKTYCKITPEGQLLVVNIDPTNMKPSFLIFAPETPNDPKSPLRLVGKD